MATLKCGARTLAPWSALTLFLWVGCGSPPAGPDYGQACNAGAPCAGGLMCFGSVPPDGYCTSDCSTVSCGEGSACDTSLGGAYCLRTCDDASDCRAAHQCFGGLCRPPCTMDANCGVGVCTDGVCTGPECTTNDDCAGDLACESGRCGPSTDAGSPDGGGDLLGVGAACTTSAACASGFCLGSDRGGVCTIACVDDDFCIESGFESTCAPASIGGAVGTYCIPYRAGATNAESCSADADCQSATCIDGQCARVCDGTEDCLTGQTCTSVAWSGGSFSGCGYAPAGGVEVRTIDIGDFTIRAGAATRDIVIATPPAAISVTLRARQIGGDALPLSFYEVEDSRRDLVFSLAQISDFEDPTIRWLPLDSEGAIAMLVPNTTTDRYTYRPGRMRFSTLAYSRESGDTGSVRVHLDALVTLAPGGVSSGSLAVRVHLVGVGVTASTAATNARVQAFLTRFSEIIDQTGISIGPVSFVDLDAPALSIIDSTDGPGNELAQLFASSTGADENVLDLFLVREVRGGGDGFNTLGIAGGIPGPPRMQGTPHSGVVVAFDPSVVGSGTGGGRLAGHVAAHEASHFLGLFHVTERARVCGPGEVPSETVTCAPFGGGDVLSDTTRGDRTNLMNWSIEGGGSNDVMSAGQGFVELRNPLAH